MTAETTGLPRGAFSGATGEITALLRDPTVRDPLKSVLRAWLRRDPIDAAADAECLAGVLGRRADAVLSGLQPCRPGRAP